MCTYLQYMQTLENFRIKYLLSPSSAAYNMAVLRNRKSLVKNNLKVLIKSKHVWWFGN